MEWSTKSRTSPRLSFVICLWMFVLCLCGAATVEEMKAALQNLKGNGNAASSWDVSGSDICSFIGIVCKGTTVTNISLSGFSLRGSIAPEIGIFTSLVWLDLSNNSIAGSIPANISACIGLTYLNLSSNKLTDQIPAALGELHSLQYLDLSQNKLSGVIPEDLGLLTSLQILSLDSNHLNGSIPQTLTKLTNVRQISLSKNALTGSIPDAIKSLSKLETFSAYQNQLSGSIPALGNSVLQAVNLASNQLTGTIPSKLCSSKILKSLVLSNNSLSGTIPEDLGSCQTLESLRLGQNQLKGTIPESFGQLGKLVYFEANQNHLSGQIPSDIRRWTNLSLLNLASNSLSGGIPAQFGNGFVLEELLLSNNLFSGPIPDGITQCRNLSVLYLADNNLNGLIPEKLCSLSRLTNLQLGGNSFSGVIPSSIGSCAELLELQLGHNQLTGSIPSEIGLLMNLQVSLNLSFNQLTGIIPDSLGQLSKLVSLDLSHNKLSGEIPETLSQMSSLLEWDFSNNLLSGPLPSHGPLSNSSVNSFANNSGLCGSPLQECSSALQSSKIKRNAVSFWRVVGITIACAAVILLIVSGLAIYMMHKRRSASTVDTTPPIAACRIFSEEVERAVDFDRIKQAVDGSSNVISRNHFSTIFKTSMPSGLILAVKKLHSAEKGVIIHQRKVMAELDKVWKLVHDNIMKPVGYYLENDLAIVIYDFVPLCSLSQKLHIDYEGLLGWPTRYEIAIGVAQGLAYLHHSCNPPMVHMDVSSSNIFLGPHSEIKVGDVEVAKLIDPSKNTGSISAVAGSFGYIAPEYAFTMRVTLAGNIYSFGVLLLELLTGRRPTDETFGDGLDLVKWVDGASSRGETAEQILDARISSKSFNARQEMLAALKVALSCTNASPLKRPKMKKVVEMLQASKLPADAHSLATS